MKFGETPKTPIGNNNRDFQFGNYERKTKMNKRVLRFVPIIKKL